MAKKKKSKGSKSRKTGVKTKAKKSASKKRGGRSAPKSRSGSSTKKKKAKKQVKKTAKKTKKKAKKAAKKTARKATKKSAKRGAKKSAKKTKKKAAKKKAVKKKAAKKKAAKKKTAKKKTTKRAPAKPAGRGAAKKKKTPAEVKKETRSAPEKVGIAPRTKKQHLPDVDRPTGMYGGVVLSDSPKPFPRSSPYSDGELKALKEALLNERARLRKELASLEDMTMGSVNGDKEPTGYSTHIAENASDMQATEAFLGVRSLEEERLEQVEEALQRVQERKRYGLCVACGNKIGIERLIAKPHAHLCMDCRRRYEKKR